MSKKVYNPIHDVFQTKPDIESNLQLTHSYSSTEEHDADDSTQSDELPNAMNTSNITGNQTYNGYNGGINSMNSMHRKKFKEPSKYTRHLKKQDGDFFTRNDIQYQFLHNLLSDTRQIFYNDFQDVFPISTQASTDIVNVTNTNYNARLFVGNKLLTFSQLYVLTIASSKKCSKILRDKLLFDNQVALSTCMLSLLVNMGKLNTTVNFFLEMTSQLRTFHSIPSLQHHSHDPKSLQDTPRIKSILKAIPSGQELIRLSDWYESPSTHFKPNPINLLFTMCENVPLINTKWIEQFVAAKTSLFEIFDSDNFEPKQRADFFLWLMYIHIETDLNPEGIKESLKIFNIHDKFPMDLPRSKYDIDTESEIEYGQGQFAKRQNFLKKHPRKSPGTQESLLCSNEPNSITPFSSPVKEDDLSKFQHKSDQLDQVELLDDGSSWTQEVEEMIEFDLNYPIRHNLTQNQLKLRLKKTQRIMKKKRKLLGLIRALEEYEDVTMATVIGVRGKKRKKFNDGIMGYETDYLRYMGVAKKIMLNRVAESLFDEIFIE